MRLFYFATLSSFVASSLLFSEPLQEKQLYGHIVFPATTQLHPKFIDAVLLLHSFCYEEARKLFVELQKEEPAFALAYWGEAMTYNHPLWNELDLEAARQTLGKLAPTAAERLEKAPTEKEKGWIRAIDLLFGEGDKKQRDWAYALEMCQFYLKYPDDNEIATFYALSLLGKDQGVRRFSEYMKAASVANDVFIQNPQHPGAMHYLIHSVDDAIHAPLGLNAAFAYSKIAPHAAHALHMPSHIYLALGMWEDVVICNQSAWESSHQPLDVHSLHALQWLHYGHLQLGHNEIALALLQKMEELAQADKTPMFKWYYAVMRAAHIVNSENWNLSLPSQDMRGVELGAVVSDIYANALIQLYKNREDISSTIQQLEELLARERERLKKQGEPGKDFFTGIYQDGIDAGEIVLIQLKALNQKFHDNRKQAEQLLEQAVLLDDKRAVGYGPPLPPKPSRELLGELLLEEKRLEEACNQFEELLQMLPKRKIAVQKVKEIQAIDPKCELKRTLFFQRLMAEQVTE